MASVAVALAGAVALVSCGTSRGGPWPVDTPAVSRVELRVVEASTPEAAKPTSIYGDYWLMPNPAPQAGSTTADPGLYGVRAYAYNASGVLDTSIDEVADYDWWGGPAAEATAATATAPGGFSELVWAEPAEGRFMRFRAPNISGSATIRASLRGNAGCSAEVTVHTLKGAGDAVPQPTSITVALDGAPSAPPDCPLRLAVGETYALAVEGLNSSDARGAGTLPAGTWCAVAGDDAVVEVQRDPTTHAAKGLRGLKPGTATVCVTVPSLGLTSRRYVSVGPVGQVRVELLDQATGLAVTNPVAGQSYTLRVGTLTADGTTIEASIPRTRWSAYSDNASVAQVDASSPAMVVVHLAAGSCTLTVWMPELPGMPGTLPLTVPSAP